MTDRAALQSVLGHSFADPNLLQTALTHRSVRRDNNERLEYLGDAILSFTIANALYRRYPDMDEGELSRVRSGLVSGEMLTVIARRLGLGPFLVLGAGELKSGGQERDSILADAVEAIIGAIYLDSDVAVVQQFVLSLYDQEHFDELTNAKLQKDPKSSLQEWLQAHKFPLPQYEAEITGKAHEQTFHVTCTVVGLPHQTIGESSNRRKGEQIAAASYLAILMGENAL
ncbi:MAG: ribonuclease III [Coxiella sp. (in: Bacteria)]|nr:MAG: ribonuclease III [Coxiella sp. (in: g-proteobacteria)]